VRTGCDCWATAACGCSLKRAWSDGTTLLLFEPVELLEKLAALTPPPAINLILTRWAP
jgi:hypothetical protein